MEGGRKGGIGGCQWDRKRSEVDHIYNLCCCKLNYHMPNGRISGVIAGK